MLALALATACASAPRPDVAVAIAGVDPDRLRADVEALASIGPRPAGDDEASASTLAFLESELRELGLEVEQEPFEAGLQVLVRTTEADGSELLELRTRTCEQVNLLATLPGAERPWEVIELGAHYDTVQGSPGADDNASGVAALLELARILRGSRLDRTVRLCFYAAEEPGLLGSAHHAARLAQRREEQLIGAIVVDMIGYARREPGSQTTPVRIPLLFDLPETGDFVLVAGGMHSGGIGARWESAAERYTPDLGYYSVNRLASFVPDGRRSDHASYWSHGLRAVLLTDTAELRNPAYHRPGDTPDELDYEFLADVTRALAATVLEWAGGEPPPTPVP